MICESISSRTGHKCVVLQYSGTTRCLFWSYGQKTIFSHQTIDLTYMSNHAVIADLVARFETMGLTNFLQHRCGWNETIIRQFYATLEIDLDDEKLWWKTGKKYTMPLLLSFCCCK